MKWRRVQFVFSLVDCVYERVFSCVVYRVEMFTIFATQRRKVKKSKVFTNRYFDHEKFYSAIKHA